MNSTCLLTPGLVSITFRALTPEQIVARAQAAGLHAIEWGADVHVPPNQIARAREVAALTRAAGLQVSSYGSYYKAAVEPDSFTAILHHAVALGAPRIRVWAGPHDADAADAAERIAVADDLRRIARLAASEGIRIALEFHSGTLTSRADSAAQLLGQLDSEGVDSYWQPRPTATTEEILNDVAALAPWLCHAHVFQWTPTYERRPLAEGSDVWPRYLRQLADQGRPMHVQMEYVPQDDPELLKAEATTLRGWLDGLA